MPRTTTAVPKLRKRSDGRAVVTLDGKDRYVGTYGTPKAKAAYGELIAKWLAGGRRLPEASREPKTVGELIADYWTTRVVPHYTKNGEPTSEVHCTRSALRPVRRLFGDTPVDKFGPLALEACRRAFVEAGFCRQSVNKNVNRIRSMFRWGVSREIVRPETLVALQSLQPLLRGRTKAPDLPPVTAVADHHVEAVRQRVNRFLRAVIDLQLLTGARPGEILCMRTRDVDTNGPVWTYRPSRHKGEHYGREAVIHLGAKAQAVLRPFLRTEIDLPVFSPKLAEAERRAALADQRKTPLNSGNRAGTNRSEDPERTPGDAYTTVSYGRAVRRACKLAGIPPWHAHQLRHSAAERIEKEHGLAAAQAVLRHRSPNMTRHYSDAQLAMAQDVATKSG